MVQSWQFVLLVEVILLCLISTSFNQPTCGKEGFWIAKSSPNAARVLMIFHQTPLIASGNWNVIVLLWANHEARGVETGILSSTNTSVRWTQGGCHVLTYVKAMALIIQTDWNGRQIPVWSTRNWTWSCPQAIVSPTIPDPCHSPMSQQVVADDQLIIRRGQLLEFIPSTYLLVVLSACYLVNLQLQIIGLLILMIDNMLLVIHQ